RRSRVGTFEPQIIMSPHPREIAWRAICAEGCARNSPPESGVRSHGINSVMLGEREARGKSIHSVKRTLDLHEMDSLPLAAYRRSAENDKCLYLNARRPGR